ncbi:uncharacterized protein LOC131014237 [Salvia miltiorrhiza]|uniref:uncharacterized protein LOC131014237 n=1 Tax=Salvia miltiorrhiza TaxID=226208 RepID=UPI0025AB6515|nr:uncharacterized protein LOC131014237 [Salvia miltiorrhiza]
MERFYKRALEPPFIIGKNNDSAKSSRDSFDAKDLPTDPGLRIQILEYNPNIQDEVRRAYISRGPCQPLKHNFPFSTFGKKSRRFNSNWFSEYANWLEYSISKDAAFCLCCYLFKSKSGEQANGDFVGEGFRNWKKGKRLKEHVGGPNSAHNKAWAMCEALKNQKQHIQYAFDKQTDQNRRDYRMRLNASIDCVRFLLRQGLAFRGDDESKTSANRAPSIQKDIVNVAAAKTINIIMEEIGGSLFSILVDESRDISMKEQMSIVLRFVNKDGCIVERFVGVEDVTSTTALALKEAICCFFSRYNLSISRLRGQGYDGASNMQGAFNGLKALILKENPCAFYIHCFAHQLQLALVAVAKKHILVSALFFSVTSVVNVVGASSKRCDILHQKEAEKIFSALNNGDLVSGRGLNQETTLKRSRDTRWSSHYDTLISLITLFSSTIKVLEIIVEDGVSSEQKGEANNLLGLMQSFDFVFTLHLMRSNLGITNELSKALQRKDQDIVNAMALVKIAKKRLQMMRDEGWDSFYDQVSSFCNKENIDVPNMSDKFVARCRSRRKAPEVTNLHHYRFDVFFSIIDMQLMELNDRFSEIEALDDQLETYILDMHSTDGFGRLKGIGALAQKMAETKKHEVYPLLYLFITLALILPVATATVERVFSAMNIIKNRLRCRMGDQRMNDSLVVYIEKEIFDSVDNESIIQMFQSMKTRRFQL